MSLSIRTVFAITLSLLAVPVEARDAGKKRVPRKAAPYVFATYPASDDGATFQIERQCEEQSCAVVVRLMKGGRELGRETCDEVPLGKVEEEPSKKDSATRNWNLDVQPEDGEFHIYDALSITPFQPTPGMRAVLCERVQNAGEPGPFFWFTAIGVVNGKPKRIWSEKQTASEGEENFRAQVVLKAVGDGSSQIIFSEDLDLLLNRYAVFAWSGARKAMSEVPVYAMSLGEAADENTWDRLRDSRCSSYEKQAPPEQWVMASAFPRLKTSGRLVLALTTREEEAKDWQRKLQACRKSQKPPPILRLR